MKNYLNLASLRNFRKGVMLILCHLIANLGPMDRLNSILHSTGRTLEIFPFKQNSHHCDWIVLMEGVGNFLKIDF